MHPVSRTALLGALLIAGAFAQDASSQIRYGSFPLTPAQEVPPNGSAASGTANVQLDTSTNTLSWTVSWTGMTATAAHFHGPAPAGVNAGIMVGISPANPSIGSTALDASDAADVLAGLTYVNVHSAAFPGGQIRGQVHLSWESVGGGTSGVNGLNTLVGSGPLTGGTPATLTLSNAAPSALVVAWLSFAPVPQNFFGGTIHALPYSTQLVFFTNPAGVFSGTASWPTGIPAGTNAWFQFLVADNSVIWGITMSNGVKVTTP